MVNSLSSVDSVLSSSSSSSKRHHRHQNYNSIISCAVSSSSDNEWSTSSFDQFTHAFKRIQEMFALGKLCDVKLVCSCGGGSSGSDEKRVEISAHRVVLSSASDYFYAMFTNDLVESTRTEIQMNDMNGEALLAIVNFIYTGSLIFFIFPSSLDLGLVLI